MSAAVPPAALPAMRILVTGAAGFIGAALCGRLLDDGHTVLGFDSLNDYYAPALKQSRLDRLLPRERFSFRRGRLEDREALEAAFADFAPQRVVNLAAQAGVRYSLEQPRAYVDANIVGFLNVLEACRAQPVEHLVYASSSSVYGGNRKLPFAVEDSVDHPLSLYAASKKAGELMAHTYSHLYRLPTTGLRFFTVYGPWGRPDMAYYSMTRRILAGEPIDLYNHGQHRRDFTYIDDIVEGVTRVLARIPGPDPDFDPLRPSPASSAAPYRVYNIGHQHPVELARFIDILEQALGRRAEKRLLPLQPGDVVDTEAELGELTRAIGSLPSTPLEVGIPRFVEWYRSYHRR